MAHRVVEALPTLGGPAAAARAVRRAWPKLVVLPNHLDQAVTDTLIPPMREHDRRFRRRDAAADAQIDERPQLLEHHLADSFHRAYAQSHHVFAEVQVRVPDFAPRSILDFGAGASPASWAARAFWPGSSLRATLVEPNAEMRSLNSQLIGAALGNESADAMVVAEKMPDESAGTYDLVVAVNSLHELPPEAVRTGTSLLLQRTSLSGLLCVVAPATHAGFDTIMAVRAECIASVEASIVAPCPHSACCPLAAGGEMQPWHGRKHPRPLDTICHTTARVRESSASAWKHRKRRRGGTRVTHSEAFVYLVARRREAKAEGEEAAEWSRIVREPRPRKGHVGVDLCTAEGHVASVTATQGKSSAACYRFARKSRMGMTWPFDSEHLSDAGGVDGENEYEYFEYDDLE